MTDAFEAARSLFAEGMSLFDQGRYAEAEQRIEQSLHQLPGRASTLLNLGVTRLRLGRPQEALQALDAALAARPDDADAWGHRGVALAELGRAQEALAAFDQTLALAPGTPAARFHRAMALAALSRHEEALAAFEGLLQSRPDDAQAWLQQARSLQCLGRHEAALPSYRRALVLDPTLGEGWSLLGQALNDRGELDEAAACFEQALAHGADAELNHWLLAGVRDGPAPDHAPAAYVQRLFDGYAADFDRHLLQGLRYQAPAVFAEMLAEVIAAGLTEGLAEPPGAAPAARGLAALDLGCGTGLCAELLRRHADVVDGVDLSGAMLAKAQELGRYRQLLQADAVAHLQTTAERYGWVLAADVLIYIGALDDLFAGVRRVLLPGGRFAFSVEAAAAGVAFELRRSLRYAHGEAYLREQAQRHGLHWLAHREAPLREDQGRPVAGLYVVLGAP